MKLPTLYGLPQSRTTVTAFGGLNRTAQCGEGEFCRAQNLSARQFPALSPRLPRRLLHSLTAPHGLYAKNGLVWVDGTTLYYNGAAVGPVADSDKTFCGLGSKVLIWPDKLYLDTTNATLHPLGAKWAATGQVRFTPARLDGDSYEVKTVGTVPPEEPENGDYWLDTSGEADVLRVYASASDSWAAVSTPYVRIESPGIGQSFARYDTVTIAGVSAELLGTRAAALNADCVVWDRSEDSLTVTGLIDRSAVQETAQGEITVERRIPDLDFVTECDNRVWGVAKNGQEIYACKLGDATNWFSYMGTAADSYTVTVGSDGEFTGAASCMGYVLLFKEGLIHRVYGSKPANYQVVTMPCPGVKAGCERSLATVDSTLYYYSPRGVMACDGGLPEPVGTALGELSGSSAAAGAGQGCYYLSVTGPDGPSLYCYDTVRGLWHREDATRAVWFAPNGGELIFLNEAGRLWAVGSPTAASLGGAAEGRIAWFAETGPLHQTEPGRKFLSKLELRLTLQAGAAVRVFVQYDSAGPWQQVAHLPAGPRRSAVAPVLPRRCDHLRLRIEGEGEAAIQALARTYTKGSEL